MKIYCNRNLKGLSQFIGKDVWVLVKYRSLAYMGGYGYSYVRILEEHENYFVANEIPTQDMGCNDVPEHLLAIELEEQVELYKSVYSLEYPIDCMTTEEIIEECKEE